MVLKKIVKEINPEEEDSQILISDLGNRDDLKVGDKVVQMEGSISGEKFTYPYELPTLEVVHKRIDNFLKNHADIAYKEELGRTRLGEPIEEIVIGHGKKELFIVGGTHSNEIIAVDVITQFLNNFDQEFDESLLDEVTIKIIPIQNPEGYKVLDKLMTELNDYLFRTGIELEEFCKNYYLNYRTDDLIYKAFSQMNMFMTDENFIKHYKEYILSNPAYKRLHESNVLPTMNKKLPYIRDDGEIEMLTFDEKILSLSDDLPLDKFLYEARKIIMFTRDKLDKNNTLDRAFEVYLDMLFNILSPTLKPINLNDVNKLHQLMIRNVSENAYYLLVKEISEKVKDNEPLKIEFNKSCLMTCSKADVHKIIGEFAATLIEGKNLNADFYGNAGIGVIRNGDIVYSKQGFISNLVNYSNDSPLGSPLPRGFDLSNVQLNEETMPYAIENILLMEELKKSMEAGTYGGCILCHGTGGELYYKPNEELTSSNYLNYSEANEEFVLAMQEGMDESVADLDPARYAKLVEAGKHYYTAKDAADKNGFGDFLRSKYPRVIMLENSVMGGNPFAPYGDAENFARTINCFGKAITHACKVLKLSNKRNTP